MKYGAFLAALRKSPLKQVFLLAGLESYFIEKARKRILDAIDTKGSITVFENTSNLQDITAALNMPPLFSDKTVVLIKDSAIFKESKTEAKTDSKKKDKELDNFIKTLSMMPSDSYIIFILNDKPDKRRKLFKTVQDFGLVLESEPLRPWNINEWLSDKLTSLDITLDRDANLFFMNMINMMKEINLSYLDGEFDKLALYTKEKRINKKTMEEVFSSVPEVSAFALMDAISEKNIKKALLLFRKNMESGVFLPLIVIMIARHVRQLLQVKLLMKEGVRGKSLAAPLGLNPVIAERIGKASALFDENTLDNALILLSDADYAIKTGQGGVELIEEILILLCDKTKRS